MGTLPGDTPTVQAPARPGAAAALSFLQALWPDPPGGYLMLWILRSKQSLWFPATDLEGMARAAAEHAPRTDVYFGCGLSPRDCGEFHRCPADEVAALPGLWADIDIKGPAHKKKGLPPDLDAALSLADAMPRPPSLVVHSGHGLQAWWLFKEPWVLGGGGERSRAKALADAWQSRLRRLAAAKGWADLDAVADLARVLRLPGTLNHKIPNDTAPVKEVARG
jgi:hypothetical protein